MENMILCQSCGMPMGETDAFYGTEADGSKSKDYCQYCYENGKFSGDGDMTMEQMIEVCVPHVIEGSEGTMNETSARAMMQELFPTLKRWQA